MERIENRAFLSLSCQSSKSKAKNSDYRSQDKLQTYLKVAEVGSCLFQGYFSFSATNADVYGGKRLTSYHIALLGAFTLHWAIRIAYHYRHKNKFNSTFELIKKSFPTIALAAISGGATISFSRLAQECSKPLTLCDSVVKNYSNYVVDTQYHQELCKTEQPCDPVITNPKDPNIHFFGLECTRRDGARQSSTDFQGNNFNICKRMTQECKQLINAPYQPAQITYWNRKPTPVVLLKESAVNRVNAIFENYSSACINEAEKFIEGAMAFGFATISFLVWGILKEKALHTQLYPTTRQYSMVALEDFKKKRVIQDL